MTTIFMISEPGERAGVDIKTTRAPGEAGDPTARNALRRSPLVPTVATILAVTVFVSAGNWQRGRMAQKEALLARYEAAAREAPSGLPANGASVDDLRYRRVEVAGRFDADRQILIDNRVHDGRAGYHVVAPLLLDDGRAVLVNRGWIAAGATRAEVPASPPPTGRVVVRGRLALPAEALRLGGEAPSGVVWPHLDPARFAAATGLAVSPVVVEQSADGAPADGLVRDWPRPDFGIDKHRIYMGQWYLFAALALGLWAWFVARPWARRLRR
jgi:surfeit locus 1 family protein